MSLSVNSENLPLLLPSEDREICEESSSHSSPHISPVFGCPQGLRPWSFCLFLLIGGGLSQPGFVRCVFFLNGLVCFVRWVLLQIWGGKPWWNAPHQIFRNARAHCWCPPGALEYCACWWHHCAPPWCPQLPPTTTPPVCSKTVQATPSLIHLMLMFTFQSYDKL